MSPWRNLCFEALPLLRYFQPSPYRLNPCFFAKSKIFDIFIKTQISQKFFDKDHTCVQRLFQNLRHRIERHLLFHRSSWLYSRLRLPPPCRNMLCLRHHFCVDSSCHSDWLENRSAFISAADRWIGKYCHILHLRKTIGIEIWPGCHSENRPRTRILYDNGSLSALYFSTDFFIAISARYWIVWSIVRNRSDPFFAGVIDRSPIDIQRPPVSLSCSSRPSCPESSFSQ